MTKKNFCYLFVFFLIWRSVLFGVGAAADHFLKYAPTFPYYDGILPSYHTARWFYSWANFDGVHYLTIADHGYIGTGLIQAFFPLLPYVFMHMPHEVIGDSLNSLLLGLVLTNGFAFGFVLVWFLFVKQMSCGDKENAKNDKLAYLSVAVFFTFPTALFFGALYTESLFLLLAVSSFLAAKKQKWWLVGVLIALASATRVVGVFLVPAMVIELWLQYCEQLNSCGVQTLKLQDLSKKKNAQKLFAELKKFTQQNWRSILWICAGSIGLLSYMAFLTFSEFHDPLYFLHVQARFNVGRESTMVIYPQVVWRATKILLTSRPFDWRYFSYVQEFVVGVFGLVGLLLALKTSRWSDFTFSIAAFFLPTLTGTFSSLPRYFLACFSFFYFLTKFLEDRRWLTILWLSLSTLLLLLNTILFIQGYWVA